ncbi:uncharacterized protein [Arachis hypogaea]|uniref:uncharacterized protein n=1 Tax=Arachis hypogaea TaxID=3818 RepID=UPI003B21891A
MSTKYFIWPVILIPYNLPPWLCMKQTSFTLSMIIPGPKMLGNDIDIYLEPLMDELKQLWDGIETYDANKGNTFKMRAALMWTISDFLGLGNLSGWITYSGLVCPTCNVDAKAQRLTFSRKWCYMGHHHFLNQGHKYRLDHGYSSNIARCVDLRQCKLSELKSHNCHILMEQLLPILMEMIFPPSFFTVMVHLTVHLVDELKLEDTVYSRWMYPIERYLGRLKQYVRNRALAEGSITEGRVDDQPIDVTHNSGKTIFPEIGKASGAVSRFRLTPTEKDQAHRHVLVNCEAVVPFLEAETKRRLRTQIRLQSKIDRIVRVEFPCWFKDEIQMDSTIHSKEMKLLACGPMLQARRFGAYNINGYKFRTITNKDGLKIQNSGVYVSSNTRSYASMRDNGVAVGSIPYYEKIMDIIELNYSCHFTVVLFKCIWADTTTSRGIKQDHMGLTSINFTRLIHIDDREEDEPYILASEAHLVYYVDDEVDKEWSIVIHVKPQDLYDMGGENDEVEAAFSPQPGLSMSAASDIGDLQLTRDDDLEDPIDDASENFDDVA